MIKKLLLSGLLMTAVILSSCEKQNNSLSNGQGSEMSIQTVSIITCVIMAIALLVAYSYRRR